MLVNNDGENEKQKYNFLTELKIVKSSSYGNLNTKLELDKLERSINRKAKSRSRSRRKRKKKKRNRRFKYMFLSNLNRKSNCELKMNNYEYKFKVLFGKIIVKKKYLEEIVKRRRLYSERVKKIKIVKRTESVRQKEDTSLDLIKKYSFKVLCTNRAVINFKKEKEKELFEKLDSIDKNNINNEHLETPQINPKFKLSPIFKKMNLTNNNSTPIIQANKNLVTKANLLIKENTKTNKASNENSFNLRQNYEIKIRQNINFEKKDILNQSNPELLPIKPNNNRNKKFLLKIIVNNSTKNENFKQEKSLDISPRKIEITDAPPQKKLKRERSDFSKDFRKLYYVIGPGNASYLVKNCMLHRTNWKESYSYVTNLFNFKWLSVSHGIDFFNLSKSGNIKQIVNHFENHICISNKANLFLNMMNYCEQRKISVFKYIPLTYIFELKMLDNQKDEKIQKKLENLKKLVEEDEFKFVKKYDDIGRYFKEEEFLEEKKRRAEFFKENSPKKNKILYYVKEEEKEEKSEDENKIFEGKYPLYRDYFGKMKLKEKMENKQNNLIYFSKDKDKEKQKLSNKYIGTNTVIELPDTHSSGKNMWLIKAINLNRGMCIKIVNSYKKLIYILNRFKEGVNYDFTTKNIEDIDNKLNSKENKKEFFNNLKAPIYYCEKVIIQKYIERPLLYKGRKCDMRIWVLVTHNMKVYFFKEGHLKTCSIPYEIESKDSYTHITNYSFQKYNEYFQKYEKGNEVPFYEFQKFINEEYPEKNYKLNINLYSQIKEIISISMKSVKDKLNKNCNAHQFEIFGYDFMLDENFNLFLIEVNTNPGLEESSPWIEIIVPRMLDDALRLTIDQLFYPGYDFSKIYKKEQKQQNNLKEILNDFYNKINFETKTLKTEILHQNKSNDLFGEKDHLKRIKTEYNNIADLLEKIDKKKPETKIEINSNNNKYISPFPVPGYKDDDNLWEFVCDLTSKDPLDDFLEKEDDKCYTGLRYLINKKKSNES